MNATHQSTVYGTEVRVLLCSNCGAPFDAAIAGGVVQCRFCNAQNQLMARTALPAFAQRAPVAVSEEERMRRLRAQDNMPLLPPASLAHLFGPGGDIPAWKEQEVFAAWQAARKRTASQALDAAEELFFLTEALGNQFTRAKDWTRHRAMLESALEVVFLPRHRSIIASNLCLGACRQGDAAGAESWLGLADPASDDLYADSSYRVAKARVAALKGDFQGVLAALGYTGTQVPIHDAMDCLAACHRANALERIGRMDLAVQELGSEMAKSPQHRAAIETIIGIHQLCAQSFPVANAAIQQQSAHAAAGAVAGGIDKVFVPLGGLMGIVGIGLLLYALVTGIASLTARPSRGRNRASAPSSEFSAETAMPGVILLVTGGIFFAVGRNAAKQAAKARRLALHGKRARGTILGAAPTGMSINDVPQMQIRLRVEMEGAAPYEAEMKMLIPQHQLAQLGGGR